MKKENPKQASSSPEFLLQVKPSLCIHMVSITMKRFFNCISRPCPCAFQVTKDWLKILTIVSLRVILVPPCLEPFLHLFNLIAHICILEHRGWDTREGYVSAAMVLFIWKDLIRIINKSLPSMSYQLLQGQKGTIPNEILGCNMHIYFKKPCTVKWNKS